MVMDKKGQKEIPTPGFPPGIPSPDQGMAKYVTAALLAAGRSDCDCIPCQLLRKVSDSMTKELLEE